MSEQELINKEWDVFEKWFDESYPLAHKFYSRDKDAAWEGWQAATTESNKRIAELESEVAELKEKFKSYKEESLNEIVSLNKACYEYKTNINDLREALEKSNQWLSFGEYCYNLHISNHKLLQATPAESLQAFENEVIEKCAKVCDEDGNVWVSKSLRALKQEVK